MDLDLVVISNDQWEWNEACLYYYNICRPSLHTHCACASARVWIGENERERERESERER